MKLALFVTLLLLMLQMAKGTDESLREIPASEILTKIENSLPVEYDHVIVKVSLSLNDLKNLPTKHIDRAKEDYGTSEEIKIIASPIRINDSVIDGIMSFNNTILENITDFAGSTFNRSASFSYSKFNSFTDFQGSTFNSFADFRHSTFNNDAHFIGSTFNSSADFRYSTLNSDAYFWSALFSRSAYFMGSTFNRSADFYSATFNHSDFCFSQPGIISVSGVAGRHGPAGLFSRLHPRLSVTGKAVGSPT